MLLSQNISSFLISVRASELKYRALMDFYHGGWDGYEGYKTISQLLTEEGYTVEKNFDKPLNIIDLSKYNTILFTYPITSFSQDELNAIRNYVYNGGGLLLVVDTQMYHGYNAPNQIAELFGVHFYGNFDGLFATIVNFEHPITKDKKQEDLFNPFLLWDAAIDRYPSNATILVRAISTLSNIPNGTSTLVIPPKPPPIGIVAMVALNYGKGRAVFGPCNGLVQPWGTKWYGRNEPNKMLLNTVKWLVYGSLIDEILNAEAKLYEASIKSIKKIQEDIGNMAGEVVKDLVYMLDIEATKRLFIEVSEEVKRIPLSDMEKEYMEAYIKEIIPLLAPGTDIKNAIKRLIIEESAQYENAINNTHFNFISKPIITSEEANIEAIVQDTLEVSRSIENITKLFIEPQKELHEYMESVEETGERIDLSLLVGGGIAFIIGGPAWIVAGALLAHKAITTYEWSSNMIQAVWVCSLYSRMHTEKERITTIYTKEVNAIVSSLEKGMLLIPSGKVESIYVPPAFYLIGINEFGTFFRNTGLIETNARVNVFISTLPLYIRTESCYSVGVTITANDGKWLKVSIPSYVDFTHFLKDIFYQRLLSPWIKPQVYVTITTEYGFAYERSTSSGIVVYEPSEVPYVWLYATSIPAGKSKTIVTTIVVNYGSTPVNVTVSHDIPSDLVSLDDLEFITSYTELNGFKVKWILNLMPMEIKQIKYKMNVPILEVGQEIELPAPTITYIDPLTGEEIQREGFGIRTVASDAAISLIQLTAPREVFVGDTFPIAASIKNFGQSDAKNVNIKIHLPKGLSIVSGKNIANIGNLAQEQTYDVTWLIKAECPGNFTVVLDLYSSNAGSDIWATSITSFIPATVDFKPDALNVNSKADENSVTVYIELPAGYDVKDIDVTTVKLSTEKGTISAQLKPIKIGDCDNDGISDLMIKFPRQEVIKILDVNEKFLITITGKVSGGWFKGTDMIKVLNKK